MKIGIIRIDRMGDMILTLPIIKAIKLSNPSSIIHVFCSNKNFKIIENFKYIDKIYNSDHKLKKNNNNYDYIFNFSPGWKSFKICLKLKTKYNSSLLLSSRYKKTIYSKLLTLFIHKLFFSESLFVNRIKRFNKKKSLHQTNIMFELIGKSNIKFEKDISIEKYLIKSRKIMSKKKICLIHLSSKWVNEYYNEENLIKLINILNEKFNLILTTDETTSSKFVSILKTFPKINNQKFDEFNTLENITILENLDFKNWVQAIYSSDLVITPECGCTHIAALCGVTSKIIYDANNKPDMIYEEYHPWKSKHEKFYSNNKKLNLSLIKNL